MTVLSSRGFAGSVLALLVLVDLAYVLTHSRVTPHLGLVPWSGWGLRHLVVVHATLLLSLFPPPPPGLGLSFTRLLRRARRPLRSPWLVAGVVLGFLLCSWRGRALEAEPVLEPFERFSVPVSPHTLFRPSSMQLLELARRRLPPDKIAVIVGGSSVMNGFPQRAGHVWTGALQRALGASFAVLNLAPTAGPPTGYGLLTSRMLLPERPRLIYVCDWFPNQRTVADGGGATRYLLYDADARGLLPPHAPMERWLAEGEDAERAELRVRSRLDASARFTDLWTTVGWRSFFTLWSPATGFTARSKVPDPNGPQLPLAERFPGTGLPDYILLPFDHDPEHERPAVEAAFPPELRRRTLVSIDDFNPYHLALLAAKNVRTWPAYVAARAGSRASHEACGLRVAKGDRLCSPAEFTDWAHRSEEGGERLAAVLAPQIVELARELGY